MSQRILLVEDNIQASNVVKDYFEKNGCQVEAAFDGLTGLKMARSNEYDIIFLDAMMPGMDGFTFLKNIREEKNIPIIMLTSLADEENMLKGYERGVDDYVTKPFSLAVLKAKMEALLKRRNMMNGDTNVIQTGELKVDMGTHTIEVDSEVKKLPKKQFEILMYLMENKGTILTREQILERAWRDEYGVYDRVVDTHIKKLRALLGSESERIETVVGVGYMWK